MDLSALEGRRVALLGAGIDVTALLGALRDVGAREIVAFDDAADLREDAVAGLAALGAVVRPTSELAARASAGSLDVIVRSPGFNRYRPELVSFIERGSMTTPIDLWLGTYGSSHHVTIVTGTKGKSTTTTCLAVLLRAVSVGGAAPIVMGNIGVPAWSIPAEDATSDRPIVCELSSFQASDTSYVADLAIVTSLGVDHVDWHGTVERYHADKLGPVRRARSVIGCDSDTQVRALLAEIGGTPVGVAALLEGRGAALEAFFGSLPAHLAANFSLAVAAAEQIASGRIDDRTVLDALASVEPLPGRQRTVGIVRGVEAVDNALASNPLATAAGLASYPGRHVWLILGGADRGVPLDPILEALRRRDADSVTLIGIPHTGAALCEALAGEPAVRTTFVAESIDAAVDLVAPVSVHDVVLFSPSAPTPPELGTWVDRSAAFVAAVDRA